ncbi:hypothetical protein NDU88_004249 [Pleurodeles waltl]|uniref:Uncharacterized protein n=1 Tax=Pleurodeles waltl TaxID=8319 RepID=A0AAV7WRB8_PLEWA|nr:hypothetical protein NDU88_004249 [Pleurodeles waltl]
MQARRGPRPAQLIRQHPAAPIRQEASGGPLPPWGRRRAWGALRSAAAGTASWTGRYDGGRGAWAYPPRGLDRAACLRTVHRPEAPGGLILEDCSPESGERRRCAGPSLFELLVLLRGAILGAQASGPSLRRAGGALTRTASRVT